MSPRLEKGTAMTNRKSPQQLRDYSLAAFKAYQDILLLAFDRRDISTTNAVLPELEKSLRQYLQSERESSVQILQIQIDREPDEREKAALRLQKQRLSDRLAAAQDVRLAKDQVFFGLAARALEVSLAKPEEDRGKLLPFVEMFLAKVPSDLQLLTRVFDTISDRDTPDFWGWHWFDFQPDGEAHFVDVHTRPNRLYVVKGLRILAGLSDTEISALHLRCTDDLDFTFDETNQQGIPAMIRQVREAASKYDGILDASQIAEADAFLDLIARAKAQLKVERQARLAAAPLDEGKVFQFKQSVLDAYRRNGRFRVLFEKLGNYTRRLTERPGEAIRSWGYNQLDDKGAFVASWHVSYGAWGENYGRGLAQAEDQSVFSQMAENAPKGASAEKGNLIPDIYEKVQKHGIQDPILFQSLRTTLEYGEIRRRELFIPQYRPECPQTSISGLDGFIGVLKYPDLTIPVVDVFVRDPVLRNHVIIANVPQFVRWIQFSPSDQVTDDGDIVDTLLIKIIDLNADNGHRNKLLRQMPGWLKEHPENERESFLRARVVVHVFEKYNLVFDPKSAVGFTVEGTSEAD